jgi:hypothetical protein
LPLIECFALQHPAVCTDQNLYLTFDITLDMKIVGQEVFRTNSDGFDIGVSRGIYGQSPIGWEALNAERSIRRNRGCVIRR